MSAIPRTIHYCWFGGKPLPKSAVKCIDSWKKFFPDYEIKEWNESNFDVNVIPYTAAAYKDRKYAFVSDYARFWILYNYGGVYFDTDVEALKPIDDIVEKGPFMGNEICFRPADAGRKYGVAPGLGIGAEAGNPVYKMILDHYSTLQYGELDANGRQINVVDITTRLFRNYGWVDEDRMQECAGVTIYPSDYFCPFELLERAPILKVSENTRTIHRYAGTWLPKSVHIKNKIGDLIGRRAMGWLVKIKHMMQSK